MFCLSEAPALESLSVAPCNVPVVRISDIPSE